ncbi:division/cell wall cluster transcriptional repressor MraZ [Tepidimicrobium xylanilyticum]|uniref:Transcriptional regulator MraZ n=1 Tax=Tepidimicrobium xylanilyticum TaxID=1123352 RepID=A0A1H2SRB1_9FIRM|nr:division/cell wall cluster transcriptional repressor MraZ [Tepidimicrobium xylanilyticum]GMG96141.1 transcriptional regulator MraZ [Tepidimicrobium xylanilyticum]SDW34183.1 MraZ protein [Tepidimicrobium xylanilyticum]
MFIGEYQHTIDNKGRLIMPSKFREGLGPNFIMTKGLDNCLFVYPMEEWQILESKLRSLPLTNRDARAFVRFFFAGATECILDKQGRVLIPSNLREHARLDKEAIIIGVAARIEIWSKEEWILYNEDDSLSYDSIAEKMADLGI